MNLPLSDYLSWFAMLLIVATSLAVVMTPWPILGALSLIASLLLTAALYVALDAPFNAVTQVLIYAGGILVLFIYILMLLGVQRSDWQKLQKGLLCALFLGMLVLTLIPLKGILPMHTASGFNEVPADFGGIEHFGRFLLSQYAYPFELISAVLVAAIVGVVYLTRKES